ncbi:hypothetical protein E3E36_01020 [Thermococcus sp. M36]|uniref:hypothetical protein n=1 Tax=Thermococcus sp. M36 TaxID=1638261 RepID=UPI00143C71B4|nr:hypothetical protein [Thermococcus sp. M36]NJE04755.1 hypothetical protein [Thermococcus sp. M36]
MLRKALAVFLVGVLVFVATAVVATNVAPEPQITSDPLVRDSDTYVQNEGQLYAWISGYASQTTRGLLYNVYGGASSSGACDMWAYSFDPSTVATTHQAWWSASIIATGWCPFGPHTLYAEITWVPGFAPTVSSDEE